MYAFIFLFGRLFFSKSVEFKISQADNRKSACNQSFTRPTIRQETKVRQAITKIIGKASIGLH
jgi:hypothetical protein